MTTFVWAFDCQNVIHFGLPNSMLKKQNESWVPVETYTKDGYGIKPTNQIHTQLLAATLVKGTVVPLPYWAL